LHQVRWRRFRIISTAPWDNGLTQGEAAEVLTHLAFYVGWPNVFSALPIAKEVFEKRAK
jgi:4-carboxymuconolactone decarboxylase